MSIGLGHLYIVIGIISFLTCVVTLFVLIKKFLAQPPPSFFSYSDIIASSLFSLALLMDGVIGLVPAVSNIDECYHLKLLYGLFVVAIVTGFFSVLGMSIERFHVFAVVRDYSTIKRKFSIIWFLSSWTLSIVFVIILLPQIRDNDPHPHFRGASAGYQQHKFVPASAIFPGPHSVTPYDVHNQTAGHQQSPVTSDFIIEGCIEDIVPNTPQIQNMSSQDQRRQNDKMMYHRESASLEINRDSKENVSKKRCPPEKSFPENSQNAFGSLNEERF